MVKLICSKQTGGTFKMDDLTLIQNIEDVTPDEIDNLVMNDCHVVLDFSAAWCGPCKKLYPYLEKISDNYSNVYIFKIDVSSDSEYDQSLGDMYEINSLPTLIYFKHKNILDKQEGFSLDDLIINMSGLLTTDDNVKTKNKFEGELQELLNESDESNESNDSD